MIEVSIICPIHRYGGLDMLFAGLEHQTFPKEDYEIIIVDKLYRDRKDLVWIWAKEHDINVRHFPPKNNSNYHVHSSVLNECLEKVNGKCVICIGDYTYMLPHWMEIHYAYHQAGYCLSAPQKIYGMPKLSTSLDHPISVFNEEFNPDIFKLLPQFNMDPKLQLPNGALIDHRYSYNRNDSFPTEMARKIKGWDEGYNNRVGPSNKEFYLRLIHECNAKIACDSRAEIYRIMSYPIPPFTEFLAMETDDSINMQRYKELCKKYNVSE
jgi:hypothetical protein